MCLALILTEQAHVIEWLLTSDQDQLLPEVAASEEAHEGRRGTLKPVSNVLHVDDLPFPDKPRHLVLVFRVLVKVVVDEESLNADGLGDDVEQVADAGGLLQVVLGDHPARRDAPIRPHVRQNGLEHGAADVVEVDVDAFGEAPAPPTSQHLRRSVNHHRQKGRVEGSTGVNLTSSKWLSSQTPCS